MALHENDPSYRRLLRSVRRLAGALARLERQAAAEGRVSVPQLRILLYLRESAPDGARVSKVAEEQSVAVSTMTRNLAVLERAGWLARTGGTDDRRSVYVRLTEAGHQLASRLQTTTLARFRNAFDAFHPSDRVERAAALDHVANALERVGPSTALRTGPRESP